VVADFHHVDDEQDPDPAIYQGSDSDQSEERVINVIRIRNPEQPY
jgi:hypothetical protein